MASPLPAAPVAASAALLLVLLLVQRVDAKTLPNLTEILARGGGYGTFLRHLGSTDVGQQTQNQMNNSDSSFTVFAPNDGAFHKLGKFHNLGNGTYNDLTHQHKVELIQYHLLPMHYNFTTIRTARNPLHTQSPYTFNVSVHENADQFNISTGVKVILVTSILNDTFPLCIFRLDTVLVPPQLLKVASPPPPPPPPVSAPPPSSEPEGPPADDAAPSSDPEPKASDQAENAVGKVESVGWIGLAGVAVGLLGL